MTGRPHRDRRNDAATNERPTDQDVDDLVVRAADLIDELRSTFAEIQELLLQDTP